MQDHRTPEFFAPWSIGQEEGVTVEAGGSPFHGGSHEALGPCSSAQAWEQVMEKERRHFLVPFVPCLKHPSSSLRDTWGQHPGPIDQQRQLGTALQAIASVTAREEEHSGCLW